MSPSVLLILLVAAIVISIWLSTKFDINLGVCAWAFAYIIGVWCMGLKVKEVVNQWPTSIVFQLMSICIMFAFANQNGTIKKMADGLLWSLRKHAWTINLVLYFVGFLLAAMGPQSSTINAIMCGFGFSIAAEVGLHPVAIALSICHGAAAGSQLPWSGQGVVVRGVLEEYYEEAAVLPNTWILFLGYFLVTVVLTAVVTWATGGFKVSAATLQKPEPMDKKQKTTLWIMIIVLILAVVPSTLSIFIKSKIIKDLGSKLDIQALAFIASAILAALKLGDCKQAVTKGVPWNTIVLVGGMCTLIGVAEQGGVTDLIAAFLSDSVPHLLIGPAICLIAGIMSVFTGAMSAVFPMLTAVAVPLAAASGINSVYLVMCVILGARITASSPFSTGGSLIMGYCNIDEWQKNNKMFKACLISAGVGLVLSLVVCFIGSFIYA